MEEGTGARFQRTASLNGSSRTGLDSGSKDTLLAAIAADARCDRRKPS